jgi:anti-sigma factor RsiW
MHLTDIQLNEYSDNETSPEERAQIESHLLACEDCAARVTALQTLFAKIESLPELALSRDFASPFTRPSNLTVPQFPRWLTLTATLQAACALTALVVAAPFVTNLLPSIEIPSLAASFSKSKPNGLCGWTFFPLSTFHQCLNFPRSKSPA